MAKKLTDAAALKRMVEDEGLFYHQAAAILGVSKNTVARRAQEWGIRANQQPPPRAKFGDENWNWRGGRRLIGGYYYIYAPLHPRATKQGAVAEHRLVMEEKMGRFLAVDEVVHHLDGNARNNTPENLAVFRTNADHIRESLKGRCPKWSPENREKMLSALQAGRKRYQDRLHEENTTFRQHQEPGDCPPPQTSGPSEE